MAFMFPTEITNKKHERNASILLKCGASGLSAEVMATEQGDWEGLSEGTHHVKCVYLVF